MPTATIPLSTLSVQSATPTKRYGSPAQIPMRASSSAQRMLARGSIAGVPAGAIVSSAEIRAYQAKGATGSVTLTATENAVEDTTKRWSTATTWATKPNLLTNVSELTRSGPAAKSLWALTVTDVVQAWVAGVRVNDGWTLSVSSNTAGALFGQAAPSLKPVLVVVYEVAPAIPSNLHPSSDGIVSVAKPTLTFQAPAGTTAINIQVDPAGNGTAPAFDSGEVPATAGLLNLATTSYPGLDNGSSTQWRARSRNALGWSVWSAWVSFTRQPWGTLTINSPGATSDDPSPVITATYAGRPVTQWRARLLSATGAVVEDSGWTPGSAIAFGTTKPVAVSGIAEVQVRDDLNRVATTGDNDYLSARLAFTVTTSSTVAPIASVTVEQQTYRPWVDLRVTRTQVPDEIAVYRNGTLVLRTPGPAAYRSPGVLSVRDVTAPMNVPAVYSVCAVVNGKFARATKADEFTPRCSGIWLMDEESGADVAVWGDEDQDQSEPEVAVVHTPIGGGVVRRRLARSPRQGAIEGQLADVGDIKASTSESNLREWAEQDAGHPYRLVLGNRNDPVILGDIELPEQPANGDERLLGVSLSWWAR